MASMPNKKVIYDVAVVGGGVVGCGVARALTLGGFRVVLLEKEDALASGWASAGNTGIACTHHDCEEGTLEHDLLKEATSLNLETYQRLNIPHRLSGTLYLAWTQQEVQGPLKALAAKHGVADDSAGGGGDDECCSTTIITGAPSSSSSASTSAVFLASAEAVRKVAGGGLWEEKDGGDSSIGSSSSTTSSISSDQKDEQQQQGPVAGLWVRGEVTVDPWLVPIAWATQAEANGAMVRLSCGVTRATFESSGGGSGGSEGEAPSEQASLKAGIWRLSLEIKEGGDDVDDGGGDGDNNSNKESNEVLAAVVINCGGLWADDVDALLNHHTPYSTSTSGDAADAGAASPTAVSPSASSPSAPSPVVSSIGRVTPRKGDYVIFGGVGNDNDDVSSSSSSSSGEPSASSSPASSSSLSVPLGGMPLASGGSGGGGRGPYVWRTVHGDVMSGPTNEPWTRPSTQQQQKTDAAAATAAAATEEEVVKLSSSSSSVSVSEESASALAAHARKVCPCLLPPSSTQVKGSYAGLRPALLHAASPLAAPTANNNSSSTSTSTSTSTSSTRSDGDYLIGFHHLQPQWLTCAGVRSTGLTASLAIGEHVKRLLLNPPPSSPSSSSSPSPSSILWPSVGFAPGARPAQLPLVAWPRLPDLTDLQASYADRNDGCVDLAFTVATTPSSGAATPTTTTTTPPTMTATHRVTHPQTRYGLSTRPPFRPIPQHPPLHALIQGLQTAATTNKNKRGQPQPSSTSSSPTTSLSTSSTTSTSTSSPLEFLTLATEASVLRGGYTNQLYLVRVPPTHAHSLSAASSPLTSSFEGLWVVRKSGGGDNDNANDANANNIDPEPLYRIHSICRFCEHACVTAASAQGLTTRAFLDPQAALLAQEYICEPQTFTSRDVQGCLDECVDLVKQLHDSVDPDLFQAARREARPQHGDFKFDVFATSEHYLRVVRGLNPSSDDSWAGALPSDMEELVEVGRRLNQALHAHKKVDPHRWPTAACHNDLVVGNWVRGSVKGSPRRLYLIDFEYSACGDRCFDLANLCVNSDFDDEQTERVVKRYLRHQASPKQQQDAEGGGGGGGGGGRGGRGVGGGGGGGGGSQGWCMSPWVTTSELRGRVELLKLLSDLREGLWALAHGSSIRPLKLLQMTTTTMTMTTTEEEEATMRKTTGKEANAPPATFSSSSSSSSSAPSLQPPPAHASIGGLLHPHPKVDDENEDEEEAGAALPSSFYVAYGLRHLDRFRRHACVGKVGASKGGGGGGAGDDTSAGPVSGASDAPAAVPIGAVLEAKRKEKRITQWIASATDVQTGP